MQGCLLQLSGRPPAHSYHPPPPPPLFILPPTSRKGSALENELAEDGEAEAVIVLDSKTATGQVFGDYEAVGNSIGEGSFGKVWIVRNSADSDDATHYALKVVRCESVAEVGPLVLGVSIGLGVL